MFQHLEVRRPASSYFAVLGATVATASLVPRGLFTLPGQPARRHGAPSVQLKLQQWLHPAEPPASARGCAASSGTTATVALAAAALCVHVARGRRPAAPSRASKIKLMAVPPRDRLDAVHLTGDTLAAALKMRCDFTGADYAIYWVKVNNEMVVSSEYVTPGWRAALKAAGKDGSFAEASESVTFPAEGLTLVSAVYNLGEPMFIADASSNPPDDFSRKDSAAEYGVKSICFVPAEAGVLEFGSTESWTWIPDCPMMPKKQMRDAFENLGASYVMFWAEKDGEFSVIGDYVTEESRNIVRNKRGDDKTFCSESRAFKVPANGEGPVETIAKYDEPFYIPTAYADTLSRRDLAKEFGIKGMHLIPVKGGVLECGVPESNPLSGNTLQAALKMRCETSGSGYALYWTEVAGEFVVAGSYVSPAWQRALEEKGVDGSFAEASTQAKLSADGASYVAQTASFQEPMFIQEASSCEKMERADLAVFFGVESMYFVAVKGGVLELGTSSGPVTATWEGMPDLPDMPKSEMKKAFDEFEAEYVIFWCWRDGQYVVGANYTTPERVRGLKNERGDDKTFADESKLYPLPPDDKDYVWTAATSGKEVIVKDPASDPNLQRGGNTLEFRICEIHFVPCEGGVLEYGKSER